MEQYFDGLGVLDDYSRVRHAPTYLRDLAQLWWRRVLADQGRGDRRVDTWAQFKAELRRHFVPTNAIDEARTRFRRLRQTGSISDYIREFFALLLELNDISDRDALFHFKDGLKEFARLEVNRRDSQTLNDAIAVVESLPDYSNRPNNQQARPRDWNRPRPSHQNRDQAQTYRPNNTQGSGQARGKSKPHNPCYVCGGPHWVRECLKRTKVNAMETQDEPRSDKGKGKSKNKGNTIEDDAAIVESLHQFGTMSKPSPSENALASESPNRGLLYADILIYGKSVPAMFDTGASHNFLDVGEAKGLKLKLDGDGGSSSGCWLARGVRIQIGEWIGKTDFTVLPMDDFRVVLGLTFFRSVSTFIPASTSSLVILDRDKPTIVTL
ncbi:PREDICTED: uncharacterized protein LOC104817059 [Tarenaya hassleriana]|uniref:uncharacterized protein LOC104817059 n=1 Tax=Tarenaya hassleriana TaxID=28532 RepID=UPI00053C9D23|nr:PREDICTED: uncharacterized protein LOC104817059 [Tarenaya hassleriana]